MNLLQGLCCAGWVRLVLCAVLSFLLLCTAPATASSRKDKPKIFTGKIVAMDRASNSVIINGTIGSKSFSVDRKLLKGVKVGDKVKATYSQSKGGQGVIKKIDRMKPTSARETVPKKSAHLNSQVAS